VDAVLCDFRSSPLAEPEKALFAFVEKLNDQPHAICQQDADTLKTAGWSDEAVYDAITVCALFNFYNRWCDGSGVHALPPEEFAESGKRLARFGYIGG